MSKEKIPFAIRMLKNFCPSQLLEEIEGDLLQKFERDVKALGVKRAKLKLLWNVIRYFRAGIVLRNKFTIENNQAMLIKNYFVTTIRHIRRSKVNFGFKLGGLALAVFSFLSIALYVSYQLSFDKFHKDYQNIYRVTGQLKENGSLEKSSNVPASLGPLLYHHLKEIGSFTRIVYWNGAYIHYGENVFSAQGELVSADSSLFNTLTFHFLKGNKNALKSPNAIVLTKSLCEKIFGSTDALQKQVTLDDNKKIYEVSAVVDDLPVNSHLGIQAIVLNEDKASNFGSIDSPTIFTEGAVILYVKFAHTIDPASVEYKIDKVLDAYLSKADRERSGFKISLQPLKDIHLGPDYRHDIAYKGSSVYIYSFSTLGILLLIVAAINYINLSIADFNRRARETGVRKVLGARKHQLVTQVILETLIFSVLSFFIGVLLLYLLFPQVTSLLDSDLRFSMLLDRRLLTVIFIGMIVLIFLSAWFPARQFAWSGITQNLKSKSGGYNSVISQSLLFAQFAIAATCIACTLVAGQQVEFIHNKDLGIDRKNLMVFSLPFEFTVEKMKALKQKLKQLSSVTSVANSSFRIGEGYGTDWYFVESREGFRKIELYEVFSDDELFETLGIKILEGRTFNAQIPSDSGVAFLINETAARELGWKNPVGKRIYTHPEDKRKWDGTVVGLVQDVNISPLYEPVRPLVMRLPWQRQYPDFFVYVRYLGNEQEAVDAIGKTYKEVNPGYPFAFRFVDELYNHQHQKESKAFASLQFGTYVIILVSMLGIFSMAAFISIKRMKEFGIRKVLGASVRQIASLHIGYFIRLALLACLIALPLAYFIAREWLNTFAYRIDLTYAPFMIVFVVLFVIVISSGSYSAWKSGQMNPVDVIKME